MNTHLTGSAFFTGNPPGVVSADLVGNPVSTLGFVLGNLFDAVTGSL
ncbi:hypothetical protein [Nocardia stercoris]|nr:hypothetical protein [Nocardia stercoris]